MKICSSHKSNGPGIHRKPVVVIRQIYLKTICIHDWNVYLDTSLSKVVHFGPGVYSNIHPCSGFKLTVCDARCLFK